MHNWKWMDLSKIAGLNINRRLRSSDRKHNLSLRLVLLFHLRCCFDGSLQFTSSTVKQTKLFHSNFRDVFHFFIRQKHFEKNVSRWMSAKGCCKLQAPIKGGNFGANLTHLCGFWLDVSFFSNLKKTSFAILVGRIIFLTCENHRSPLWLAKTYLRIEIYDIAFWWVFLSMYIIKKECIILESIAVMSNRIVPSAKVTKLSKVIKRN